MSVLPHAAPGGRLPPLRQDLRLNEASPEADGSPAWVIEDPVVNRFFRIGWLEFECLLRWELPIDRLVNDIQADTPLQVDAEQVQGLARFLERHQLLQPSPGMVDKLAAQTQGNPWLQWRWWLHHYLFFRIPLVRPQAWLARVEPLLRWLFTPWFGKTIFALGCLGLMLTARQWDVFQQSLTESISPEGLAGFLGALAIAKTAHELGHALVATHYGLRVAHMGVAFLVCWPMLYTDTGESWRLRSRYQRLAVSAAGIITELGLAALATLAWALVAPGALKNALFYLATTSWVLSLALNISPFMRFDGYFILSDWIDFPNLHERAGALARAWLRRTLLGWDEPDPETFPTGQRRLLRSFALVTWIYRLGVFLGIAVAVYFMFFKLLGIFLFAVEIIWFVLRPFSSEFQVWFKRRDEIHPSRLRWGIWLLLGLGLLLVIPWKTEVRGSGFAHPALQMPIYAPYPAQIAELHPMGDVPAGTQLARFTAPEILARGERADINVRALESRLSGLEADDKGQEQRNATQQRLGEQFAEARAASDELGRLSLQAEFAGRWMDVDPLLQPGVWVNHREPIGILVAPERWEVDAYIEHNLVEKLSIGDRAMFYPDNALGPIAGQVKDIDPAKSQKLAHPMLSNRFGGPIPVAPRSNELIPSEPRYRVRLQLDTPLATLHEVRGTAVIRGKARSPLLDLATQMTAVLIRESGF